MRLIYVKSERIIYVRHKAVTYNTLKSWRNVTYYLLKHSLRKTISSTVGV